MRSNAGQHLDERTERPRVLVFAPHTRIAPGRSGIHRVTMRLIEHLPQHARVDLVKWDEIEGQLRYCDRADMRRYFHDGLCPAGITVHRMAHRVDYRFADTIDARDRVIVLMPEVFHLAENGNEIHARLIAQSIVDGWTTAAIFYDLIPLKSAGYAERDAHARCIAELARVDVVMPISHYVERDLRRFWRDTIGCDARDLERNGQQIAAVPLADCDTLKRRVKRSSPPKRDTILLLGTVEPRKQQVQVIRAFQKLRLADRAGLRLAIIGGVNPQAEVEFRSLITSDPAITWYGHASDDAVDDAFAAARFSVFASREEGFGLPIVESLSRNVPCLTSNAGAMREAAEGGGCLLVDVETDSGIEEGLTRLAFDDVVVQRLRREIEGRSWRSWDEYARDVVAVVTAHEGSGPRAKAAASAIAADPTSPVGGIAVTVIDGSDASPPLQTPEGATSVAVIAASVDPMRLPQRVFEAIARADAWFCHNRSAYDSVIARAAASGTDGLLSGCCGWSAEPATFAVMVSSRLAALIERRERCRMSAARDAAYRLAWQRLAIPHEEPVLTLVISTYNGGVFIERNIAHMLQLMQPLGGRVSLVVVDNASTDDTPRRIDRFVQRGEIESIRVSSNTGLLGNLHAISTLVRARHVWAIGVDDIIVPGALERILDILADDPACPFIMPNFAVYHRETFAPEETCMHLLADSRPVGQACRADGTTDVRAAASQHDNLLTAFYIIVFRSDLMAAVFNRPFTAPFFGSLVDTVPSTKVILEAFPDFAAAWLEAPVISGNAHNTWRHNRVAWHGILMPLAFELAREAGLDRHQLRAWARQHVDLLAEAERLFPNPGVADTFPPEALDTSFRVFGSRLLAPAEVC